MRFQYRLMILALFSLTSHLCAEEVSEECFPVKLNADEVDYKGQSISLSGHVIVEHELGIIRAGDVCLLSSDPKSMRFVTLHMQDDVVITLQNGGELSCEKADIDYQNLNGLFEGNGQEGVTYTDHFGKNNETPLTLVVNSKTMEVFFDQAIDKDKRKKPPHLKKIKANVAVQVEYNRELYVMADHAVYARSELDLDAAEASSFPGSLTLYGSNEICHVKSAGGDVIEACEIQIDTIKRQLKLVNPRGVLQAMARPVEFRSDQLIWNEKDNVLLLNGAIEIVQKGFGKLVSDKEVKVQQELKEGKKQIATIESKGLTCLTYVNADKKCEHHLTCPGSVLVDHRNLQTLMTGLYNDKGKILDEGQLYFKDEMGEIYADTVVVNYAMQDEGLIPKKLVLKGNVRIFNHGTPEQAQYALADCVEFFPETKEMLFASTSKNRVLFFDKGRHLQVSAPKLKIKRDTDTQKDSIRGFGDVRFSFVEKEFDQLRKRFRFKDEV